MKLPNAVVWVLPFFLLASAVSGAELLPNGGFEELRSSDPLAGLDRPTREFYGGVRESPFQGWGFGGRWEGGDYSVAASDEAHSGKYSCRITCGKKGRGGIASLPLKLKAGSIIRISFWMKAQDAAGGRIFLNFEGSPGDGWNHKDLRTGTFDWTHFSKRAVVPGGKTGAEQTIVIFLYSTCQGSVWVDDFSVHTVDVNSMAEAPDEPAAGPNIPQPITEPKDSLGYRLNVVPPLEKVFREDDFAVTTVSQAEMSAARNEYESLQVVLEAPWRPVTVKEVQFSNLNGPSGAVIPSAALTWERVDYVETTVQPPYFAERGLGRYPDPLMPPGEFTVEKLSRTPLWITLKTPKDCPAGRYAGTITIVPNGLRPATLPLTLTVWNFALTDETHLRTMTWLGGGLIRAWYGHEWTPEGDRKQAEAMRNYEDFLLAHRLGPGGEVSLEDSSLERLIGKGMNAFVMGTAPNLKREGKTQYSPEFVARFTKNIRTQSEHLREKGWLDKAYVYVYDEAPKSAWPEVKRIDRLIHAAAPQVRILQCLNEPEGVRELTGFADVFDVYVGQYHKTGVAESQKTGAEVWLAICCYPMDHPNFFLEYPLLDLRVTPWICWKYKASGFEYWSTNAWGVNWQKKGSKWPKIPWVTNTFGQYNGDGHLIYPGADLKPYSSIRFEALRDGFEDYEYLWTLKSLVQRAEATGRRGTAVDEARKLLALDEIIQQSGAYTPKHEKYIAYRRKLAEAIVTLQESQAKQ